MSIIRSSYSFCLISITLLSIMPSIYGMTLSRQAGREASRKAATLLSNWSRYFSQTRQPQVVGSSMQDLYNQEGKIIASPASRSWASKKFETEPLVQPAGSSGWSQKDLYTQPVQYAKAPTFFGRLYERLYPETRMPVKIYSPAETQAAQARILAARIRAEEEEAAKRGNLPAGQFGQRRYYSTRPTSTYEAPKLSWRERVGNWFGYQPPLQKVPFTEGAMMSRQQNIVSGRIANQVAQTEGKMDALRAQLQASRRIESPTLRERLLGPGLEKRQFSPQRLQVQSELQGLELQKKALEQQLKESKMQGMY